LSEVKMVCAEAEEAAAARARDAESFMLKMDVKIGSFENE
jgi:hypothetical protein